MTLFKHAISEVHVEVTDRCNAECPGCLRSIKGGPVKSFVTNTELGLVHFRDHLGTEFCSNIHTWNFCGNIGDPSNAHELIEIIQFLFECNPDVFIDIRTNGGARNETFWRALGQLFKDKRHGGVVWSIDGLEDTNHIYRKNVKWAKLWRNFTAYFEEAGNRGEWEFLKFKHNMHQIDEIKQICNNYNIPLTVKDPRGFMYDHDNKTVYKIDVYDRTPDDAGLHQKLYTIEPADLEPGYSVEELDNEVIPADQVSFEEVCYNYNSTEYFLSINSVEHISCIAANSNGIFLDSDGSVYPCCFHASKLKLNDSQLESMYQDYNIVLSDNNRIQDILSTDLFDSLLLQGIEGDLSAEHSVGSISHCVTCVDSCATNLEQNSLLSLVDITDK